MGNAQLAGASEECGLEEGTGKTYFSSSSPSLTTVVPSCIPLSWQRQLSSKLGNTSQGFSSLIRDNTQQYQQPHAHLLSPALVVSKFKTHLICGSCVITSRISSLDSETQSAA